MKINIKYFLLTVIFGSLILFTGKVLAQIELPRITTACESKTGQIFAFSDGFSSLMSCPSKTRRVILIGEKGDKGDQGEPGIQGIQGVSGTNGVSGAGNIAFISTTEGYATYLTIDGKYYRNGYYGEIPDVPIPVSRIRQWNNIVFLDDAGNVWWLNNRTQTWENIGHP
jgi:hypothetical protein